MELCGRCGVLCSVVGMELLNQLAVACPEKQREAWSPHHERFSEIRADGHNTCPFSPLTRVGVMLVKEGEIRLLSCSIVQHKETFW